MFTINKIFYYFLLFFLNSFSWFWELLIFDPIYVNENNIIATDKHIITMDTHEYMYINSLFQSSEHPHSIFFKCLIYLIDRNTNIICNIDFNINIAIC